MAVSVAGEPHRQGTLARRGVAGTVGDLVDVEDQRDEEGHWDRGHERLPGERATGLDDIGPEQHERPETERDGSGIIVTDLATTYRSEAHARDQLLFEVGVMDFNKYGGDITFRITRPRDKALVAMAKSGFVF